MTGHTIVQLVLMAAAATLLFVFDHRHAAIVLSGLFALTLVLAVAAPSVLATVQELVRRAGQRVATAVGLVLLTIIYFSVFLAGALWLRLLRIDKLDRAFSDGRTSNWIDRVEHATDLGLYEKPYSRPHGDGRAGRSAR